MVQLSKNDWREIYLADIFTGMARRETEHCEQVYPKRMHRTIDNAINELHEYNVKSKSGLNRASIDRNA